MPRKVDISGKRFGRFLVLKEHGRTDDGRVAWLLKCDCGNEKVLPSRPLLTGKTQSCGCLRSDLVGLKNASHGFAGTDTYEIWCGMIKRAQSKVVDSYTGKGAGLQKSWLSFENFLADMGERPSKKYSLDRIDNSKGYSKKNCRWATRQQQNENRTNTIWVNVGGEKMSLKRACRECNLNYTSVRWLKSKFDLSWQKAFNQKLMEANL